MGFRRIMGLCLCIVYAILVSDVTAKAYDYELSVYESSAYDIDDFDLTDIDRIMNSTDYK